MIEMTEALLYSVTGAHIQINEKVLVLIPTRFLVSVLRLRICTKDGSGKNCGRQLWRSDAWMQLIDNHTLSDCDLFI